MSFEELISSLQSKLKPYAPTDLAAGIGALQLIPENADHIFRLGILAAAIAGLPRSEADAVMTSHKWKQLMQGEPLGTTLGHNDDPLNNLFTAELLFYGGSYLLFPGPNEEALYTARHLLRAVFLSQAPPADPAFSGFTFHARGVAKLILPISDRVARRAGLTRGLSGKGKLWGNITMPDQARFSALKQAVRFTEDEMGSILRQAGASPDDLAELVIEQGPVPVYVNPDTGDTPLLAKPILKAGHEYVVVAPGELLLALRHALIRLALDHHVEAELASRFGASVVDGVVESLRILSIGRPVVRPAPLRLGFWTALFQFDGDKVLNLVVLTDSLGGYDHDNPSAEWPMGERRARTIARFLRRQERTLLAGPPGPTDVLHLVVVQSMGRPLFFALPEEGLTGPSLCLSGNDLDVVALLNGGRELALWEFARARALVRDQTTIRATAFLDEYDFYRGHHESYYPGDHEKLNLIVITPGGKASLEQRVYEQRDFHGVTSWNGSATLEVTCLHSDVQIPIYMPWPIRHDRVTALIEGLPCDVWIIGPENLSDQRYWPLYTQFADLFSYWIWQCTPSLSRAIGLLAGTLPRLVVELRLAESQGWFNTQHVGADDNVQAYRIEGSTLILELRSDLGNTLGGPDNAGERALVVLMLQGLRALGDRLGVPEVGTALSDSEIASIVERHAPLGVKKKVLFLPWTTNPLLKPSNGPPFHLSYHWEARVSDSVGPIVARETQAEPGIIATDRMGPCFKGIVGSLYEELETIIAGLSPDGLLEWLVERDEQLSYERAFRNLTIPTRQACFSQVGSILEKLEEELPETTTGAVCNRFLIEHITAQPPAGSPRISQDVYNHLIALAHAIVHWGFLGDIHHYELAGIELRLLPSGRLEVSTGAFGKARSLFDRGMMIQTVEGAERGFAGHWKESSGKKPSFVDQMNRAAMAEFGASLQEILALLEDLRGSSEEDVVVRRRSAVVDDLSRRHVLPEERIETVLSLLSLTPRPTFLDPGPPYRTFDVYPWRYNRALSYIRRPLLVRGAGDDHELIWGHRNLYQVGRQLSHLCLSGRLDARSQEMKDLASVIQREETRVFTELIASLCREVPGAVVDTGVKKIGRIKIETVRKQDAGDVDVLAIFPDQRMVLVIEAKSLESARTPAEFRNEVNLLLVGTGAKRSTVSKHEERRKWVEARLDEVLDRYRITVNRNRHWQVRAGIVVDREVLSGKLHRGNPPILSFREFREAKPWTL